MSNTLWWAWFAVAIAVGLFGDVAMKQAGRGPDWRWFVAGFSAYSATSVAWFVLLRVRKLSTVGTLYPLANVLGLLLLGAIVFDERLGVREWIGIVLGLIAIAVLGRSA